MGYNFLKNILHGSQVYNTHTTQYAYRSRTSSTLPPPTHLSHTPTREERHKMAQELHEIYKEAICWSEKGLLSIEMGNRKLAASSLRKAHDYYIAGLRAEAVTRFGGRAERIVEYARRAIVIRKWMREQAPRPLGPPPPIFFGAMVTVGQAVANPEQDLDGLW